LDLFFAGLGAGSFCLAAIATRKQGQGWNACSRMASFLAPVAVLAGLSMLVIDLGYKSRFWMTLTGFNLSSPMSVGTYLLSLFLVVSILFAFCQLPASLRQGIPWIGKLALWDRREWRNRLGGTGVVLALGVSVYTGVLLSASVIPLWRNLGLPFLFFLSALASGFAAAAVLAMVSLAGTNPEAMAGLMAGPLQFLKQGYRVILPLYVLTALVFVLSQAAAPESRMAVLGLMTGWSGLFWWLGAIGIGMAFPLSIVFSKGVIGVRRAWYLFSSVLVGGFLLRLVLVYSGQM
jgi:formate-dependent nitrite reductase membrane component NrfD